MSSSPKGQGEAGIQPGIPGSGKQEFKPRRTTFGHHMVVHQIGDEREHDDVRNALPRKVGRPVMIESFKTAGPEEAGHLVQQ